MPGASRRGIAGTWRIRLVRKASGCHSRRFLLGIRESVVIWKVKILKIPFQAATHVPGGLLAAKYGGKYVLSLGILSTSIFTLITPIVIKWGKVLWNNNKNTWYLRFILHSGGAGWLIALRILEGVGEGTTFPAMNTMLAAWIPVNERSKASALVFGGAQVSWLIAT